MWSAAVVTRNNNGFGYIGKGCDFLFFSSRSMNKMVWVVCVVCVVCWCVLRVRYFLIVGLSLVL